MDMYEAIIAENKILEKTTRKLVDTTYAEADLRKQLINQIEARLKAINDAREVYIYPTIRSTDPRPQLTKEYDERIGSIRGLLNNLLEIFSKAGKDFQYTAERLHTEVADFTRWEMNDAFAVLKKLIDNETAAEIGDRIREQEKREFQELLKAM